MLEYGALVVGYRALLIVVAILYAAAFVDGSIASRRRPNPVVASDGAGS